ncbi:hypothetical protein Q8W71_23165 [Methylobacterium sp. NEAU 140]|uniref:hypothetical protein n=1 Tax=Methylobacterium sp. NEAU 140 TaxID=3064945 RepID=UPI0027337299|nr:hypothetical protein [Methylobacterium sp. NEAU 140]MDP4025539.1 hypothetical protein [Methylobacterium sp. NEAU 140]
MEAVGRRSRCGRAGAARRRLLGAALPVLGLLAGIDSALAARLLAAKGAEAQGYGRIILTFDKPVAVKATVSGGVLILGYGERSAAGPERLATEMPGYVAAVRRDPDGTGLRLALQRPFRANVQQAGERVFVDLLPEGWRGLAPPLPAEVVADLAHRARAAEEALKVRAPAPPRRRLALDLARLPTLTRLSLRLPDEAVTAVTAEGPATRLRIAGPWTIDPAEIRGRPRPGLAALAVEADETSASLILTPADGFTISSEREDGTLTLDIVPRGTAKPGRAKPDPAGEPETATSPGAGPAAEAQAGPRAPMPPVPMPPAPTSPAPMSPAPVPTASTAGEPGPAAPKPATEFPPPRRAGSGLVFPFARLPAAALFERGGVAILAFDTADPVPAPPPGESGLRALGEPVRAGPLTVLRFAVPAGRLIDLAAVSTGTGLAWEMSAGEALSPSATLEPVRRPDPSGRVSVAVPLPRPGSAGWLDLDGERVAVVPSAAPEPAGNPRGRRFVDFEILPSRHGVAVLAGADDLAVRPDLDGVTVYREGGLSASTVARRPDTALSEAGASAVDRAAWERARAGTVRDTLRDLGAAAAAALPAERGPARLALARAYLANGFDPEGLAVLEAAAADDPLTAAARDTAILRGLALARLGRGRDALAALAAPSLAADPEAALWRAVAAAGLGDWKTAETGFLKILPLAARYPDDLAAPIRVAAAEAAIETGDAETAAGRAEAGPGLTPLLRDRLALVRARVAEATGQTAAALDTYGRLADVAERPVAVAAALRGTLLARGAGKLGPDVAIERLERLALTWHGGATEEALIAGLARLYLAAGRWRDAFAMVRRGNGLAPASDTVRTLTVEAQKAFDELYLDGRGDRLSGVEAVALYFDFRELAPIGRRGDAVVRSLADRLVGLDLLDSAAELLQYQIENRLTGPARAAVAARLATVRLMDGQPMRALEAIESTDMAELPGTLRRARGLIRARALSDLTRTDLALETLDGEAGPEIERLRADILWAARRWREAGEAHEGLLGDAWRAGAPLDERGRADAMRAAIAYDLAGEALGLERLKAKFAGPMARGPDARTFALLTGDGAVRAPGFREIAARATKAETLSAFLAEYRKRYPDAAVPDRGKPEAAGDTGTANRADMPAGPPPG